MFFWFPIISLGFHNLQTLLNMLYSEKKSKIEHTLIRLDMECEYKLKRYSSHHIFVKYAWQHSSLIIKIQQYHNCLNPFVLFKQLL